jgi:hypothetical protein
MDPPQHKRHCSNPHCGLPPHEDTVFEFLHIKQDSKLWAEHYHPGPLYINPFFPRAHDCDAEAEPHPVQGAAQLPVHRVGGSDPHDVIVRTSPDLSTFLPHLAASISQDSVKALIGDPEVPRRLLQCALKAPTKQEEASEISTTPTAESASAAMADTQEVKKLESKSGEAVLAAAKFISKPQPTAEPNALVQAKLPTAQSHVLVMPLRRAVTVTGVKVLQKPALERKPIAKPKALDQPKLPAAQSSFPAVQLRRAVTDIQEAKPQQKSVPEPMPTAMKRRSMIAGTSVAQRRAMFEQTQAGKKEPVVPVAKKRIDTPFMGLVNSPDISRLSNISEGNTSERATQGLGITLGSSRSSSTFGPEEVEGPSEDQKSKEVKEEVISSTYASPYRLNRPAGDAQTVSKPNIGDTKNQRGQKARAETVPSPYKPLPPVPENECSGVPPSPKRRLGRSHTVREIIVKGRILDLEKLTDEEAHLAELMDAEEVSPQTG